MENFSKPAQETQDSEIIVEETPVEVLVPITETTEAGEEPVQNEEEFEATLEDCEMLYGVVMETGHSLLGTRKGKGHRELPEERRKAQGKILHSICKKYNIKIPTEFELIIFGGAMIADWQYMTIAAEQIHEQKQEQVDIREEGGVRTDAANSS